MLLQMDIEAMRERNKLMLDNFTSYILAFHFITRYRRDVEVHLKAKDAEIERCIDRLDC